MARRSAPVKNRRVAPTSMTREGDVEHDPFDVGGGEPPGRGAWCDDGAVPELEDRSGEGLQAAHDGEQGCGPAAVGGRGAGPDGHLDQGVGSALGGGASELGDERFPAEAFLGLGPVGLEQLLFDGLQGDVDDGAVDRVEGHAPEPHAVEGLRQVDLAGRFVGLVVLFGAVGVPEVAPGVDLAFEVGEPAATGLPRAASGARPRTPPRSGRCTPPSGW